MVTALRLARAPVTASPRPQPLPARSALGRDQQVEIVHEAQADIGPKPVDQADGALQGHRDDIDLVEAAATCSSWCTQPLVTLRCRLAHGREVGLSSSGSFAANAGVGQCGGKAGVIR